MFEGYVLGLCVLAVSCNKCRKSCAVLTDIGGPPREVSLWPHLAFKAKWLCLPRWGVRSQGIQWLFIILELPFWCHLHFFPVSISKPHAFQSKCPPPVPPPLSVDFRWELTAQQPWLPQPLSPVLYTYDWETRQDFCSLGTGFPKGFQSNRKHFFSTYDIGLQLRGENGGREASCQILSQFWVESETLQRSFV